MDEEEHFVKRDAQQKRYAETSITIAYAGVALVLGWLALQGIMFFAAFFAVLWS